VSTGAEGSDRVALVVGGGTGIGLACARRLTGRGVAVMLTGRRADRLELAAGEIQRAGAGVRIAWRSADAGVFDQAEATVAATVERFGRIDIVVNAAGIYVPCAFHELTAEAWRETMSSTLDSMAYVSIAATRRMVEQRSGRVILISSIDDRISEPFAAPYNAAKSATSSLVRSMALDLAPFNIQAHAVAPGLVDTDMGWVDQLTPEDLRWSNPLARAGTPDEIAGVVTYLALDAPGFLTGEVIFVDGGKTIASRPPSDRRSAAPQVGSGG
jgi:NAD(P)-dependent dehydrogenase (short-subunit alcohol dehydrogenase family)